MWDLDNEKGRACDFPNLQASQTSISSLAFTGRLQNLTISFKILAEGWPNLQCNKDLDTVLILPFETTAEHAIIPSSDLKQLEVLLVAHVVPILYSPLLSSPLSTTLPV